LRYLQEVESVAPDVELLPAQSVAAERQRLAAALEQDRPADLLHARPELGLGQTPEGPLWRVELKTRTPGVTTSVSFQWVNGLTLEGYTLATQSYRPNQTVPVTLAWGTKRPIEQSYTTFIHLVGEDGTIWGQQDRGPGISTDQWAPGQQYLDLLSPILSAQTPPGRYQVVLGWYDLTSLQRVAVADENGLSANTDFIFLATIEVMP
ncbi:MAG: hypothetical protein MI924_37825, partial [Chloroflexales bacterium]|nr:hypothetical protein [Chloroflexales bacterium]